MPEGNALLYSERSILSFPVDCWIHEPVPPYGADQAAPENCRILAENMRYLRIAHRWSQEALGLETGLNRTMIGAIERAEVNTTLGTAEKIARAFGLSLAELLYFKPPTWSGSARH